MGRVRTMARRSFLVGSAAIAGGVAFGVYAINTPHENPLREALEDGEASFNPWVKISRDKITLITPHADIGQGVRHMQALLIAEEMDLDPGQFETDFGQTSPAYFNRGLQVEAADYLSAITPVSASVLDAALGGVFKLLGQQITGGSSATPDSFDKLREAGAVARETLKSAAAKKAGISADQLKTASGAVVLPDGSRLPYTELADIAATIEPVAEVALRPRAQWRLIGSPTMREDIAAKSTGRQDYGIDLKMEGMVHAALRLSPRRSAVSRYDDAGARAMRGVLDVVEITNGLAVIADNTWRAFQAAQALDVEWEAATYPPEQEAHWEVVAAALDNPQNRNLEWRNEGDVDAAIRDGQRFEAEYRAPYVAHQPLEPLSVVIRVGPDRVDIWAASQLPTLAESAVASITGHSTEQVTHHNLYAGGSFGHRLEVDFIRQAAEIARTRPGVPVKLTYSREEDFAQDFPRPLAMARGTGAVQNGKVTAIDLRIAAPEVIVSQLGRLGVPAFAARPETQISAGVFNMPYVGAGNIRVQDFAVHGLAPNSSWRSVGASTGGFLIETFVDELTHAAGADPLEERLRMMTDPVARQVLEAVAEMSNWSGPNPRPGTGRGVAFVESFGVPTAEVIEVTSTNAGIRIDTVWVAADVGTVVDPINFENNVQGGIVFALGAAMNSEITYADGMAEQTNYHAHEGMRMHQCPNIYVRGLENQESVRGVGEPPVPPAAPALSNAIFAATGQRLREMPFNKFVDFV